MRKRIAPVFFGLALTSGSHAQAPPEAEPPLASRAVMTGEQVIHILDETVDWYRMLGVQQQSATQPSDLLILYANRQSADRVVGLAFEVARANADLLSSQAELKQDNAPDPSLKNQKELDARRSAIQAEISTAQKQLAESPPAAQAALRSKLAELQSELELLSARRNLLSTMIELANETDANGSGVSALKEHINAIAASIPAATAGATPMAGISASEDGMMMGAAVAVPQPAVEQSTGRPGIWDLAANVLRLQGKLSTIDEVCLNSHASVSYSSRAFLVPAASAPPVRVAIASPRADSAFSCWSGIARVSAKVLASDSVRASTSAAIFSAQWIVMSRAARMSM